MGKRKFDEEYNAALKRCFDAKLEEPCLMLCKGFYLKCETTRNNETHDQILKCSRCGSHILFPNYGFWLTNKRSSARFYADEVQKKLEEATAEVYSAQKKVQIFEAELTRRNAEIKKWRI